MSTSGIGAPAAASSRSEVVSPPATDHVRRNRAAWDRWAGDYEAHGRRNWASEGVSWGVFGVPDETLRVLPELAGKDVIELGCGTGYLSAWLARRGARPVGLDNSSRQLATARTLQGEFSLAFPLVQADAEAVPLRGGSFDLAIS